jgi:hypothetical protein
MNAQTQRDPKNEAEIRIVHKVAAMLLRDRFNYREGAGACRRVGATAMVFARSVLSMSCLTEMSL